MNALDRLHKQQKQQKHQIRLAQTQMRQTHIRTAIKCTALAFAIVLHRKYGIGKDRFAAIFKDVFILMDEYIDKYDGECIEAALTVKAKEEVGVEIEM